MALLIGECPVFQAGGKCDGEQYRDEELDGKPGRSPVSCVVSHTQIRRYDEGDGVSSAVQDAPNRTEHQQTNRVVPPTFDRMGVMQPSSAVGYPGKRKRIGKPDGRYNRGDNPNPAERSENPPQNSQTELSSVHPSVPVRTIACAKFTN